MNINYNSRYQDTDKYIRRAFFRLLKKKDYNSINVKDVCFEAGINRSSFYSHYLDINDLIIKIEESIAHDIINIFQTENRYDQETFTKMFEYIKKNKDFYRAFLKANGGKQVEKGMFSSFETSLDKFAKTYNIFYSDVEANYHMTFFSAGLKAICERWLEKDCLESPEYMARIIAKEYENRVKNEVKK